MIPETPELQEALIKLQRALMGQDKKYIASLEQKVGQLTMQFEATRDVVCAQASKADAAEAPAMRERDQRRLHYFEEIVRAVAKVLIQSDGGEPIEWMEKYVGSPEAPRRNIVDGVQRLLSAAVNKEQILREGPHKGLFASHAVNLLQRQVDELTEEIKRLANTKAGLVDVAMRCAEWNVVWSLQACRPAGFVVLDDNGAKLGGGATAVEACYDAMTTAQRREALNQPLPTEG